jgi:hypothetical protein
MNYQIIANTTIDYPTKQCVSASINDYPTDLFTQTQRRFGGVIFHFIFAIYLFFAITRVCDDYFMSSLEIISEVIFSRIINKKSFYSLIIISK